MVLREWGLVWNTLSCDVTVSEWNAGCDVLETQIINPL